MMATFGENVVNAGSKTINEKIGALVEQKFTEMHSTLDRLSCRIEDNTKQITETEDRTSSLENKLA